jgi:L-alanine-DL-glutamate epimerase-like enolase superfamily enzyme
MRTPEPGARMQAGTLAIERIEIVPLDTVPPTKRRIPTGPHNFGGDGSWVGRAMLLGVSAGGITGWGEVRPINPFVGETASAMFASLRDFYGPLVLGRNALGIESILRACENHLPANPAALAVLDMALHDLVGKALGVPAHVLLGGACRERIALEWSVGLADEHTMAREAETALSKYGIGYVCVKVGPVENMRSDITVLRAIRKAIGKDVYLGIDANTTYDAVSAVQLVERADVDLTYFEQPVGARCLRDMRWIRDRAKVSVMADESVYTASDAQAIIEAEAADVLGMKLYKCGGMRRSREIAVIAEAGGLRVNCAGTANGSYIEAIAGAHLCASLPNHAFGAEFMMGLPAVAVDEMITNRPIDIRDGHCTVPMAPGLGFEIDAAFVKRRQLAREVLVKT